MEGGDHDARSTVEEQVGQGLECQSGEFVTEFLMAPEQALSEVGEILMVI